jgi:hypothetical protein
VVTLRQPRDTAGGRDRLGKFQNMELQLRRIEQSQGRQAGRPQIAKTDKDVHFQRPFVTTLESSFRRLNFCIANERSPAAMSANSATL